MLRFVPPSSPWTFVTAAAVLVGLASDASAQFGSLTQSPVLKKPDTSAVLKRPGSTKLSPADGAIATNRVPTDQALEGVSVRQFYVRRDDDKIRAVGTLVNTARETSPSVTYRILQQTASGWSQVKAGSLPAPLKPGEQGAVIYDRPPGREALLLKLEVTAGPRKVAETARLNEVPLKHTVVYTTRKQWIEVTRFFVESDPNRLEAEGARAYSRKLVDFGFQSKVQMYRSSIPFDRDYDAVLCLTAGSVTRTFDTEAEAIAFENSLRKLFPRGNLAIDRGTH